MELKAARGDIRAGVFLLSLLIPALAPAQPATMLYGTVTEASGKAVPGAKIAAKNAQTGEVVATAADAAGNYSLPPRTPGLYTVSVAAEGFATRESQVTFTGSGRQMLNFTLTAAVLQQELPNAPSAAPSLPSLEDLGFGAKQTQSNPRLQAILDRRTEMLKIHQRLGLITAAPMAAALITGPMAKAKGKNGQTITEPTNANLDFHAALGGATTVLYFSTAYFAMFAPKVPGIHKHGAIRVHEALAFIHGPGMILTPILGAMAYEQENDGEKVHGIASAHGAVAVTTAIAYGAAVVAVSWPIHLKFWEKK
ncbi:MAG: carboxypeptidase-like regulatory domain-containing protein [Terracidiphilus sp.]